ncbi:predicted protein [Coccidioides posadasii str. Silveira]|uniref:Predicted protein n=1 Tax=Coccidioides posadasii (strain RMSCC 757 / Silveira) TaxID=443226 RepID=E9DBS5_COCPS|nr:predicted protein [Coccidioides posadasii str. Silveira]
MSNFCIAIRVTCNMNHASSNHPVTSSHQELPHGPCFPTPLSFKENEATHKSPPPDPLALFKANSRAPKNGSYTEMHRASTLEKVAAVDPMQKLPAGKFESWNTNTM